MWEFFGVDVEKTVEEFKNAVLKKKRHTSPMSNYEGSTLRLNPGTIYQRFSGTVDIEEALHMFNIERLG